MHFAQNFAQKAANVTLHWYIGINVGLCINACDMTCPFSQSQVMPAQKSGIEEILQVDKTCHRSLQ